MLSLKSVAARVGFLGAAAFICLSTVAAQAQTTLRWKFKEGDKLHYSMDQKMQMKMTINGMEIETETTQLMEMTWAIGAVDSSGKAEMTQTFDRIKMKIGSPMGDTEYDSKDGKQPEGVLGQILGPFLEALAGSELAMKFDSRGETSDLKMPEKLVKAMESNAFLAQMGGMFSEEGMKNLASQVGAVLPEDAVSKGDDWDKKIEMKMPFGTMKTTMAFTYQGPETREGNKFEKIGVKTDLQFEPAEGSQIQLKVKSNDMKGTIFFDNKAGRMTASEIKGKTVMQITAMGQTIEQVMDQTVTVKLSQPSKSSK